MKTCPKCKARNRDSATDCLRCGHKFEPSSIPAPNNSEEVIDEVEVSLNVWGTHWKKLQLTRQGILIEGLPKISYADIGSCETGRSFFMHYLSLEFTDSTGIVKRIKLFQPDWGERGISEVTRFENKLCQLASIKPVNGRKSRFAYVRSRRNGLGSLNIYLSLWWWILFGLLLLGGMIGVFWLVITDDEVKIWLRSFWLVMAIVGGLGTFVAFWFVRDSVKDIRVGQTKTYGHVSGKWVSQGSSDTGAVWKAYFIGINDESFEVSGRIYQWLSEGEEVCVSHWPHTGKVSRVDKVKI